MKYDKYEHADDFLSINIPIPKRLHTALYVILSKDERFMETISDMVVDQIKEYKLIEKAQKLYEKQQNKNNNI
ncbi:hypothetical protein M0R04_10155 [Candidatus Dojkabacteria bacterium]|jgi:hypothetical protein|nr:hypothetical protein [Candidatus Dojkabacteria bacterium]